MLSDGSLMFFHIVRGLKHTLTTFVTGLSSPTKLFVTSGVERQPVSQSEAKGRHTYLYIVMEVSYITLGSLIVGSLAPQQPLAM